MKHGLLRRPLRLKPKVERTEKCIPLGSADDRLVGPVDRCGKIGRRGEAGCITRHTNAHADRSAVSRDRPRVVRGVARTPFAAARDLPGAPRMPASFGSELPCARRVALRARGIGVRAQAVGATRLAPYDRVLTRDARRGGRVDRPPSAAGNADVDVPPARPHRVIAGRAHLRRRRHSGERIASIHAVVAEALLDLHRHAHEARLCLAFGDVQPRKPEAALVQAILHRDGRQIGAHRAEHAFDPLRRRVLALPFASRVFRRRLPDVHLGSHAIRGANEVPSFDVEPERTHEGTPFRTARRYAKLAERDAAAIGEAYAHRVACRVAVVRLRPRGERVKHLVLVHLRLRDAHLRRRDPERLVSRKVWDRRRGGHVQLRAAERKGGASTSGLHPDARGS